MKVLEVDKLQVVLGAASQPCPRPTAPRPAQDLCPSALAGSVCLQAPALWPSWHSAAAQWVPRVLSWRSRCDRRNRFNIKPASRPQDTRATLVFPRCASNFKGAESL